MDREQTKAVIKKIKSYYQNRFVIDNPTEFVNDWYERLKDCDFEEIMKNLNAYTLHNVFPPSIADLVKRNAPISKAVPDMDETRAMMNEWEERRKDQAEEWEQQKALREMRKLLKIGEYSDDVE